MKGRRIPKENPRAGARATERHAHALTFPPTSMHGAMASVFKNLPIRSIREPLHCEGVNPVFFGTSSMYLYIRPPTRTNWRDVNISAHLWKTRGFVCVTHKFSRSQFPGTADKS